MKKLCVILAAVFLLSAFQPCGALESDTYTTNLDSVDGYIVKLRESKTDAVTLLENTELTEISSDAGLYRASSLSDIKKLGDDVLYYEPDYKVKLDELPNDTYASKQWSIDYLGISSAWDAGYNGQGVKIAVIDSGVNSEHKDFEGTVFESGYNVIDGSNDVKDEYGHGTFVCGILAAARNNGTGIAGFCSQATIIPIKCFKDKPETNASYIISAIYEAVDTYQCDVINLSLGTDIDMTSMRNAVEYAAGKGVIVVAAVGNEGSAKLSYPAAYDCVIGVGSIDQSGVVASFSEKNKSVFVVAPGTKIWSLDFKTNTECLEGNGTSYSTPYVSAAAVMLKQYAPDATINDFKTLLQTSSIDGGVVGYDTSYGYGKLNIKNFIASMEKCDLRDIGTVFPDVAGHWALTSIDYCYINGLFNGVTSSSFEPETVMSRAMFVTVLSRMRGDTISGYTNSFSDVPDGSWYTQPCAWGAANGIASGIGDGNFNPAGSVTREQMAVFLYRYAILYGLTDGSSNAPMTLFSYSDKDKVSPWATAAMAWAVENNLITGRTATSLCPGDSAKRCEVATIITRFVNNFRN
ncbi:MAG: S8 family serine peptidase [Oscillospiraceae bacterium]